MQIKIKTLDHFQGLPLPAYQSAAAAGLDLPAALTADLVLAPGSWQAVPTGLSIELPHGYEAQVRPRSGLALKHGLSVLNSPGTIDADYRGEIKVILINHGPEPLTICHGMRIAQLVIAPVVQAELCLAEELSESERGAGGFGSSGS